MRKLTSCSICVWVFFSAATTSCSDFCWKWSELSWIFNKCGRHTWAPNTYLLHSYQIWQRYGFQGCIWPSWLIIYSITCRLLTYNWKFYLKEILEFALHICMRVPTNKPIMFLLKAGKQGIWKSQLAYVVSWYETPPLPLKWNHLTLFLKGSWCSLGCVGIQVDVLEAQYSQLVEKINSTRDFESIRLAHDNFLTTLMAQSFLLMKPVSFHI